MTRGTSFRRRRTGKGSKAAAFPAGAVGGAARRQHDLLDLAARVGADGSDGISLTGPGPVARAVLAATGGALVHARAVRVGACRRQQASALAAGLSARHTSAVTPLRATK